MSPIIYNEAPAKMAPDPIFSRRAFVLPIYVASLGSVGRNNSGYPPYPTVTEPCQSQASRFA
jgi:hypothetical protein